MFPVYMGSTDRLLNDDHEEVYFKDMPMHRGRVKQFSSLKLKSFNYQTFCADRCSNNVGGFSLTVA